MSQKMKCPSCEQPVVWDSGNEFRPFCSERCRLLDLGEWVSGRRYIPAMDEDEQVDVEGRELED